MGWEFYVCVSLMAVAIVAKASSQENHVHSDIRGGSDKAAKRELQTTLAQFWEIQEPEFDYVENVFRLEYFFNDLAPPETQ